MMAKHIMLSFYGKHLFYWYTTVILCVRFRDKQIGILELDARYMISGMSEEGATILNTDDKLWIGKMIFPKSEKTNWKLIPFWLGGSDNLRENLTKSYYAKFQGCIGLLRVEGTLIMNETNKLLGCSNLSIWSLGYQSHRLLIYDYFYWLVMKISSPHRSVIAEIPTQLECELL